VNVLLYIHETDLRRLGWFLTYMELFGRRDTSDM